MNRGALALAVFLAALIVGGCASPTAAPSASPAAASATPSPAAAATSTPGTVADCTAPAALTTAQSEGPYFKAGSPERASLLEAQMPGTRLMLTGRVLTRSCAPVSGARLEFWQADANGSYDNSGYRLRGHLFSDAQGSFRLETVVPGLYPGRTRHIHVKVQAPGRSALTTQLYFPGESANSSDSIFRSELLLQLDRSGAEWSARFNFIVDV
jgi:protocatechuate 3,4-dioxygenase beta subunit